MSREFLSKLLALMFVCAITQPSLATWSIVAVDPETGQVGLAAATCGPLLQFIAATVPGQGVVAAQAETSLVGRDHAIQMMQTGANANLILKALENPKLYGGWFTAKFPTLQYGVATLDPEPDAGHISGADIPDWYGGVASSTYSVQGNTLRSESVVTAAAATFAIEHDGACQLTLEERLLRSLESGRDAGGDTRCPFEKPAITAMLMVSHEDLSHENGTLKVVVPKELGILEAMARLVNPQPPGNDHAEPVQALRQKLEIAGMKRCK